MIVPIANGTYESDSLPISGQECVNWYPNIVQNAGLSPETLFGTPGIEQRTTTGTDANRGAHVKNGIPYFVQGNTLYSLDRVINPDLSETYSTTSLGTIAGTKRVSMADNGTQLMILVPGDAGYIYNEDDGTPFQTITDPDFTANGAPQYVKFVDGYFSVSTDSKKWIISALNNGLAWNALDFGTAESDPDDIVAPIVFRNKLFILGSETGDAFQNAPNGSGFPFVRSNIFLDKGCFAPNTLILAHNTFMMIGGGVNESPAIWQYAGGGFLKVSTTAIDGVLAKFTKEEVADAFSFTHADKGAYFVGFTIKDRTFVFDVVTSRWHERKSLINDINGQYRVSSIVTAYGHVFVGDTIDGRIGQLSGDYYMEYGSVIIRTVATQPFSAEGSPLRISSIELTIESGVGNDDEEDPKMSMDVSRDGKTFDFERVRSIGKIGEYTKRAIWRRQGRFPRFAVVRFKLSDPVKPVIIKCEIK